MIMFNESNKSGSACWLQLSPQPASDIVYMQAVDLSYGHQKREGAGSTITPSPEIVLVVAELLRSRILLALSDRYVNDLVRKKLRPASTSAEFHQHKATILAKLRSTGTRNLAAYAYTHPWSLLEDREKGFYQSILNQADPEKVVLPGTDRLIKVFLKTEHGVDILPPAYLNPIEDMRASGSSLFMTTAESWDPSYGVDILLENLNRGLQSRASSVQKVRSVAINVARHYEAEVVDPAAGLTSRQILKSLQEQGTPVSLSTPQTKPSVKKTPGVAVSKGIPVRRRIR